MLANAPIISMSCLLIQALQLFKAPISINWHAPVPITTILWSLISNKTVIITTHGHFFLVLCTYFVNWEGSIATNQINKTWFLLKIPTECLIFTFVSWSFEINKPKRDSRKIFSRDRMLYKYRYDKKSLKSTAILWKQYMQKGWLVYI